MPLAVGARLGPYEVLAPLGSGGMGEVYKARDTRLGRTVALKVLPSAFASEPTLRARFEREARTVSALEHPHICTLHDVGEHGGQIYLVMEHLSGETLAERLVKGRLPLSQALEVGAQIAEALAAAHKHGIVHRDLKPGNVMLTKTGAKLLDFGLARFAERGEQPAIEDLGSALTLSAPLTARGTILGTVPYMAPEQLEGKDADARSDVFSLGAVLYEMLSGKRAFGGTSPASVISAVMSSQPTPLSTLEPLVPAMLDHVIRGCLSKDPDDRPHAAHDVMQVLRWVSEVGPANGATAAVRRRRRWLAWTLAPALGLALLGMTIALRWRLPAPAGMVRFEVPPPEGSQLQPYMAVAPDGTQLAFTARGQDGLDRLYVRSLESGNSTIVSGTEGALQPFWSPDGRSLGFFAQGKLTRVEVDGGGPQVICSVPELRGATWGRNGVIVFGIGGAYGLRSVPAAGGVSVPISAPDASRGETSHRWPYFLPDGRRFLYVTLGAGGGWISVGSLEGRKTRHLVDVMSAPTYVASGHLLFVRDKALRAQPFEVAAARLTGEAVTVAEPVQLDPRMWGGAPFSAGGSVLAYRGGEISASRLTWFDREGRELGSVGPPGDFGDPALSPDGGRLVTVFRESRQLAVLDLRTEALMPFTFKTELASGPCWSPDGLSIAYGSNRNGMFDIFLVPASGGGREETLVRGEATNWCDDFSPDGRFLLYESSDPKTEYDLWVVPLSGDHKPKPFLRTEASETHGAFSPNGRWVAYTSDTSGRAEVYVRAFPSGEGPWQVSAEGGDQVQWRRDGRELFYLSADRRIMAVAAGDDGPAFTGSTPRALFQVRVRAPGILAARNDYIVSPDGRRFLVNMLVEDPAKGTITVVVNWAARLRE